MTLLTAIKEAGLVDKQITIIYRGMLKEQNFPGHDSVITVGGCEWTGAELEPLDDGEYSLHDEVSDWDVNTTGDGQILFVTVLDAALYAE